MSTPAKRSREKKKAEKKRAKAEARWERREAGPQPVETVSAEDVTGKLRPSEEVIAEIMGEATASRSAASIPCKLFIGSLSYTTKDDSLAAAFEEHGEVLEATVVHDRDTGRSRGFGFVTMADRRDATKAIKSLDQSELHGRSITVSVATERS